MGDSVAQEGGCRVAAHRSYRDFTRTGPHGRRYLCSKAVVAYLGGEVANMIRVSSQALTDPSHAGVCTYILDSAVAIFMRRRGAYRRVYMLISLVRHYLKSLQHPKRSRFVFKAVDRALTRVGASVLTIGREGVGVMYQADHTVPVHYALPLHTLTDIVKVLRWCDGRFSVGDVTEAHAGLNIALHMAATCDPARPDVAAAGAGAAAWKGRAANCIAVALGSPRWWIAFCAADTQLCALRAVAVATTWV